ncbi:MAG: S-layer homology domain-containing protein, partial [Oscillospiraceae bacterium]
TDDGFNHQSNLDIFLTPSTMKTSYVSSAFPENHVSHSFDTYACFDGSTPVFLDLGDASPRSVVLQKGSTSSYKKATMFGIEGPSGANYTGVTVGGLEISQNNYLTAIATINQSDAKWGEANSVAALNSAMTPTNENALNQRDIIISVLPRDFGDGATAQNITIAKYIGTSKLGSTPQLLKVTDDKFAVLWTEFSLNSSNYDVDEDGEQSAEEVPENYVVQYIDGNGNTLGEIKQYKKINEFYKEYLTEFKGQASVPTDNNTENDTSIIKNGWYNLRAMNNYLNIANTGNAELRTLATNEAYYVENKGNDTVTLTMADGRYLGVSDTIKKGTKVKAVSDPYLWKLYDESNNEIFSLRPAVDVTMLLNASNEKNVDGTAIILWEHKAFDAPKHAEFRFMPVDKSNAKHPFIDVNAGSYYEDAVVWALNNNVTSGTSDITFSPNDTCTRGQVVTFLWRAKGSPEPKSTNNPFADVSTSDYYYKAVLWAVENDITSGTSASTFSPNDTCISGQVITFLYRANGSPNKTGEGEYYDDAINWANEGELLSGTDTDFSPNNNSPRADIVTYLYRNAMK